jgi:heme oxygenase (biliverdin-IX-beta and delta-forming)
VIERRTARHLLRDQTSAAHERLHNLPGFAALASGSISRGNYKALLKRLYGFHTPVEAGLAAALANERGALAPGAWRRVELLRQDLTYFGASDRDIEKLPMVDDAPLTSRASAIGRLYVIEGSTFGGRLLARGLDGLLPTGSLDGRRFLNAGASPAHARWSAVCEVIDDCGATEPSLTEMILAANACFAQFHLWFADRIGTYSRAVRCAQGIE